MTQRTRAFWRNEYIIAIVVLAAAFVLFTSFKLIRSDQMLADSAMYLQGTENLAARGAPVSQVQASIVDYLNNNNYLSAPVESIAKDPLPLFGHPAVDTERSLLLGHAYFILYPIALLVKFVPVRIVLMSLFVLTFIGTIALAYFMLRRRGVAIAGAALFCLLIVAQPTWWEGLLYGQFYPDCLFIFAGLLFMALASRSGGSMVNNRIWLFVLGLVCASINERGALVAGLFLLLYALFYWKKPGLDRYYQLALSIGLLCYGYFGVKFLVPTNTDYGTFLPTNLGALLAVFQQPRFFPLVALFLLVNLPLLLLAMFEWRAAVIAFALMAPNILGTIGGAEKIGWSTHYVSFFFPSLVWAAIAGYTVLFQRVEAKKRRPAAYAITGVFVVFLSLLDPYAYAPMSVSFSNLQASFLPAITHQLGTYVFQTDNRAALKGAADGIVQAVPPNTIVSSVESGMALLYPGRTIEYFPKDIDNADYAVVGAYKMNGKIVYNGAISYLGADEQNKLNTLVFDRMRRDGYDLDHPKLFPAYVGIAVVRRVH